MGVNVDSLSSLVFQTFSKRTKTINAFLALAVAQRPIKESKGVPKQHKDIEKEENGNNNEAKKCEVG